VKPEEFDENIPRLIQELRLSAWRSHSQETKKRILDHVGVITSSHMASPSDINRFKGLLSALLLEI
jgi:hypothetical protein